MRAAQNRVHGDHTFSPKHIEKGIENVHKKKKENKKHFLSVQKYENETIYVVESTKGVGLSPFLTSSGPERGVSRQNIIQ